MAKKLPSEDEVISRMQHAYALHPTLFANVRAITDSEHQALKINIQVQPTSVDGCVNPFGCNINFYKSTRASHSSALSDLKFSQRNLFDKWENYLTDEATRIGVNDGVLFWGVAQLLGARKRLHNVIAFAEYDECSKEFLVNLHVELEHYQFTIDVSNPKATNTNHNKSIILGQTTFQPLEQ